MASAGLSQAALTITMLYFLLAAAPAPVMPAVTCGQVVSAVGPCVGYAQKGGAIPPACCQGVRGLNAAARTTGDRRQACACMKSLMARFKGIKAGLVSGIPGKCGVRIPYKIGPSMDCSKVR